MEVHIDDMFMFAFCFSRLAGVGTRDWLLQGLAVAVTGLQAVTAIQAHWFNWNQALPAALTSPPFPPFLQGCGVRLQQQLQARPRGQHPWPMLLPARAQARARAWARAAQRRLARRSRRQRSRPLVLV